MDRKVVKLKLVRNRKQRKARREVEAQLRGDTVTMIGDSTVHGFVLITWDDDGEPNVSWNTSLGPVAVGVLPMFTLSAVLRKQAEIDSLGDEE
jgi:hypothetical protein